MLLFYNNFSIVFIGVKIVILIGLCVIQNYLQNEEAGNTFQYFLLESR